MRIAIVEDDPGYRASLALLLKHTPGFELAAQFPAGDEAVRAAGRAPDWDVVLTDIDMPGLNGIETTRQIKGLLPDVKVVVLTVFEDPTHIVSAICAGADGYLTKDTPASAVVEQVRVVMGGGSPLTPGIASTVLDLVRTTPVRRPKVEVELTTREREVLEGLTHGLQYKEVADELCISIDTVRGHVRALYKKLQVQNVAAAVSKALRSGLVD